MIEKTLTNFDEFILLQPQLTLSFYDFVVNNIDNENVSFLNDITTNLLKEYINDKNNINDIYAGAKKILFTILDVYTNIILEKKYDINNQIMEKILINQCNYFNLSKILLEEEDDTIANNIFNKYFHIHFHGRRMTTEEIIKEINELIILLEENKITEKNNEFISSIYIDCLRSLMLKNILLIDKKLTEKLINLNTTEGIKQSFIAPYEN